jgi:ketosteroid isomerase-like protein
MSQENVEVVRKVYEAVNRGDLDTWASFLSPEVVWEALSVPGFREVYRGRAGARVWLEQLLDVFENTHLEIEQITALSDDRVLVASTDTGRGRGSGAPVEYHECSILWFAEGLVTRRRAFRTRGEALEAAGLSE